MSRALRRNWTGTVLVTGFGRFPGAPFNPSAPLAEKLVRLRRPAFSDMRLLAHVFPTSYAAVDRDLPRLLAEHRPDILLMFGVAPKSRRVRIETVARNLLSRFPDAARFSPARRRIADSSLNRLRNPFPAMRLLAAARTRPCRAVLSANAGRYLCNYIYWRALESAARTGFPKLAAFVHIPPVRRSGRRGGKALPCAADLLRTAEAILAALIGAAKRPH
ncbi:MAG TPA: pyroglutamyl-peptidase I [Pseudorhodoplanes sp.]|jgi:pyroglutamyl-peptidase|nr:pyroglutamyl-peptidase I [Pseudorhodoplanes sp.]